MGDGYAFQRLLWLLVGLVVAPTILLALYGASAIRNQHAWVAQQVRSQQELRLQETARELSRRLGELDALAHRPEARTGPRPEGVAALWTWTADQPPPDALVAVGAPVPEGHETVWFNPSDGGPPIGVFRDGELRVAWQIDAAALAVQLGAWQAATFRDELVVELVGPEAGASRAEEPWVAPATAETDLLLRRPLHAWRLVAHFREGAGAGALVGRTAWLSGAALALLVALVLLGAVLTLGSAAREIRLSRLQTDFVSSVSHELRTPLTSIRMFVETLRSGRLKDPERVAECLDLLEQETDRLSRRIERVLEWARMESGRRVYERAPVTAGELVGDALRALRTQTMLRQDVAIDVAVPDDLPPLVVDRDAIVEALLNLLQNAVKFTPTPQRISVRAIARASEVGLTVEDNGPGIAKADRKRIFEKFYQADTRLSAAAGTGADRGSGLGLAIVRAVVRGHGGRVELDTELGRGSRFTLWLPSDAR